MGGYTNRPTRMSALPSATRECALLPSPRKHLIAIRRDKTNGLALVAASLLALVLPLCRASAQSATFDFDTGVPTLSTYQVLPVDQTAGGAAAHFRASSGAFSVQTASSLGGLRLSMFSGRFPAPANQTGSILEIQFSELVTNITFAFATIQVQAIEKETPIRLTAYTNSAATPPVGVTNATGRYGGPTGNDSWPMGTLTFRSSVPFNLVRISVPTIVPPPPTGQATDFCLDNLTVQIAGGPACTITASSLPAGKGTISGAGGYSVGLTATLTAEANLGYRFVNWTEGGTEVSSSASYSFEASADRTLVANFTPVYTITTSSSPVAGGTTSGGGSYPSGTNVTVVATANAGYAFVNWTQGGSAVTNTASYSFVATATRALVANFVRTYGITTSASPSGGGTTSGAGTYNSGSNVTVVATANPGYTFLNWTVSGVPVSILPSYSFTATANRALVANFTPAYVITTSASPNGGGSTSGGGNYTNGASVTVVATANSGYAFLDWTENGVSVWASTHYSFAAGTNRALVANFAPVLSFALPASDALLLSWPASATGYVPRQNASMDPGTWGEVTNPVNVVGEQKQVLIAPLSAPSFYRLWRP
jgi:hypothetical protein